MARGSGRALRRQSTGPRSYAETLPVRDPRLKMLFHEIIRTVDALLRNGISGTSPSEPRLWMGRQRTRG